MKLYKYFCIIMKKSLILIRIILIAIPLVFFCWLVDKNFAISEPLEVSFDFHKPSAFISFLKPEARLGELQEEENYYQPITGDPVYFELKLPNRLLNMVDMELTYRNKNQEIVELGLQKNAEATAFELTPLENKYLDSLDWFYLEDGDIALWQRNKEYETFNEFFEDPPEPRRIATYHYDYEYNFSLPDYRPSDFLKTLYYSLRGRHKMYTYIKDEPLFFTFYFQNVNRYEGADPIDISIYNFWGDKIFQKSLNDDGNTSSDGVYSSVVKINLELNDLPEGVYKMEIDANDDIFTRRIETKQSKLVFINKLYLGDVINYSDPREERFFTNGSLLRAATAHEEGLQDLDINGSLFHIEQTHKQYRTYLDGEQNSILSPKGDIELFTDGFFYFQENSFFNPELPKVDDMFDSDRENVDFILADYTKKVASEDFQKRSAGFNLSDAYRANRKVRFIISLPNLELEGDRVDLDKIRATFHRDFYSKEDWLNLGEEYWGKLKNKILDLWP